jgi:hypothetical protein
MNGSKVQTVGETAVPPPTLRTRILRMSILWAVLGAFTGASVGLQGGGMIGAIAGMIAGMVEFATLGIIFVFIGGRPDETMLGAMAGLVVGLSIGVLGGPAPIVVVANCGLTVGAMLGATFRAYLRLLTLPVILLRRLRRRHQRRRSSPSGTMDT